MRESDKRRSDMRVDTQGSFQTVIYMVALRPEELGLDPPVERVQGVAKLTWSV